MIRINRKKTVMASALGALAVCNAATPQKPNVVIVIADDLGFGDVSSYGSKTIHTPNIDSLARGGVLFNNAYSTSATSTPSRYALMTGMYPWRTGQQIINGDAPLVFADGEFTLPRMMKDAGYSTGAIGKWHLGMGRGNIDWNRTVKPGAKEIGFDYSCIIAATNDRVPTVYVENGDVVGLDPNDPIEVNYRENFEGEPTALTNPEMLKMKSDIGHGHNNSIVNGIPRIGFMKGGKAARWRDEDMADYFLAKVDSFLTDNKEQPFFLYYGLHQPHVPRAPHERFVGSTELGPRGDAIVEADWCVGQLMKMLREKGLEDNTIVVFTSDNGPVYQDGYQDGADETMYMHDPAGGLRGGKYSLYDGGTHIPMIVSWKGHIAPKVSDELVCQMDFVPTLARLTGSTCPDTLDGVENLEAFAGMGPSKRGNLVFEALGRLGYRTGDWILIPPYKGVTIHPLTDTEMGNLDGYGLFNVKKDPAQKHNVADINPDVLQRLKAEFEVRSKK